MVTVFCFLGERLGEVTELKYASTAFWLLLCLGMVDQSTYPQGIPSYAQTGLPKHKPSWLHHTYSMAEPTLYPHCGFPYENGHHITQILARQGLGGGGGEPIWHVDFQCLPFHLPIIHECADGEINLPASWNPPFGWLVMHGLLTGTKYNIIEGSSFECYKVESVYTMGVN